MDYNMDSAFKQFASSLGFRGQRKNPTCPPNEEQATAPMWARSRNQKIEDMDKNLHGSRRISASEQTYAQETQDLKTRRPQHELTAAIESNRVPRKLESIKSFLRLSNVDPRHSRILPLLEKGDHYQLENLSISKAATYQVECSAQTFKGFQNIFVDDKSSQKCQESFYVETVKPLVVEFVHRQRNVCIVLHGAEGSGRRRALFGNISGSHQNVCDNSGRSRQSRHSADADDLSSLGCDGISDVQNVHCKDDPKSSLPPIEVSFRNSRPSLCSKLSENDVAEIALDEEAGVATRMLAETFKALYTQYPSFSFKAGPKDSPRQVPPNKSASCCRFKTLSKVLADDNTNVSVEFYQNKKGDSWDIESKRKNIDDTDEGLLALRVSCLEIVDDLASGQFVVHDLLSNYKLTDDVFFSLEESAGPVSASISADQIKHDSATGIVYIEGAVEMQCQSYAAVMECLATAEESRQSRNSCSGSSLFTDKLCHTVYLISLDHHDYLMDETTISHQIVISRIDESMSNSASLALHSSYLALSKIIHDVANFSDAINRQNPLTKLMKESMGGECCTIAIGMINVDDGESSLPTLRLGEAVSWIFNSSDKALDVDTREAENSSLAHEKTHRAVLPVSCEGNVEDVNNKKLPTGESKSSLRDRDDREITRIMETHGTTQLESSSVDCPKETRIVSTKSFTLGAASGFVGGDRQKRSNGLARSVDAHKAFGSSLASDEGSYSSFDLDHDNDNEPGRNSYMSSALADSQNPFVKQYAAALKESCTSRSSGDSLFNQCYDPVKDAKLFLSEMKTLDIFSNVRQDAHPKLNEGRWQDASNIVEKNIELARQKMLDRLNQHTAKKPVHLDFLHEPPSDESCAEGRFPPEFVSVEISSHCSSERHQLALDEMQQAHESALSEMRHALKALQTERDELLKQKNDNLVELERARQDIIRLKTGQNLLASAQGQEGGMNYITDGEQSAKNETQTATAECSYDKSNREQSIRVLLRIRPMNKTEHHCRGYSCIDVTTDSKCCRIKSPFDNEMLSDFNFHKVYGTESTHEHVYMCTGATCLPKFMSGINCWVILYGLYSSGKSFTLGVSCDSSSETDRIIDGVLPRFTQALFQSIRGSDDANTYTLKCSVVGLYLEQMFDLLYPQSRHAPFLSESPTGIHIVGATEAYCFNEEEVMSLVHRGYASRDTLSSMMTLDFRYFHIFVVLTLEQYNSQSGERKSSRMWFANISVSHSAESGSKRAETRIFKRSLSVLDNFVNSLSKGTSIPDYRASKLSFILKDALVGNSFTTTLLTASPSSHTIPDTLKVIEFGQTVQKIKKAPSDLHIEGCADAQLNMDQLRSMCMSAESEILIWRQLADSLTRKNCLMEKTLNKERQAVQNLSAEKRALEQKAEELQQRETKSQDLVTRMCRAQMDANPNANNMDFSEMKNVLSIFDSSENLCSIPDATVFPTRSRNDDGCVKEDCSMDLENFISEKIDAIEPRHGRNMGSRSHLHASMITLDGAFPVNGIEDKTPDESPLGTRNELHLKTPGECASDDMLTDDSFYFISELQRSLPNMNVLRGRHPFKGNNICQGTSPSHLYSFPEKGL
ncbi:hypothetical protein ACHAWX_007535 [Stephanocyclus meneghinianus]